MNTNIKDIWIAAENWAKGQWNYEDDNTDVIVTLNDNRKFVASFFTYRNIQSLVKKNQKTGEELSGKYFWASDMVLVHNCSRKSIEEIVEHLVQTDDLETIFDEITGEDELCP